MLIVMATTTGQCIGYGASGLALGSAVVAQAAHDTAPSVSGGAMTLGIASIIAAGAPHLMALVNRYFDDRKDVRATAAIHAANQLLHTNGRLVELERIAKAAGEIERQAAEDRVRYAESQSRIEWLEDYIATIVPAVHDNQADLRRVADEWKKPAPPALKAVVDPAPLPPPPPRSGEMPAFVPPGEVPHDPA